MIEKIKGIKVSGECFKNNTEINLFNKDESVISLIFGKNGSGKSTIARMIDSKAKENLTLNCECAFIDKTKNIININNKNIFVFNEEFINSNIGIKSDGLDAVVLFGKQNDLDKDIVDIERKLKSSNNKLEDSNKKIREYEDKNNSNSPEYFYEKLKKDLKSDDDWAQRESKILNRKQKSSVNDSVINSVFSKKFFNSKEVFKSNYKEIKKEFEQLLLSLSNFDKGKIEEKVTRINVEFDFFKSVEELLAEKIEEPYITDRDIKILEAAKTRNNDLEAIVKYFRHDNIEYCPFCFRNISNEERKQLTEVISNVLNEHVDKHKAKLREAYEDITNIIHLLDSMMSSADNLKVLFKDEYDCLEASYKILNSILNEYSEKIESKLGSIFTPIEFANNYVEKELERINYFINELEQKRISFNNQVDDVEKSRERASELNKILAFSKHFETYEMYKELDEKKNNEKSINDQFIRKIEEYKKQIDNYNNQKKNIVIAKDKINKSLEYIFFTKDRLQLEVEDGKYFLLSNNKRVSPNKVSTGERNMIALCYYFTCILSGHSENDGFCDELFLLIDDPISSFDIDNKTGMVTYLKSQLYKVIKGNANSRIVIMSHDLASIFDIEKACKEIVNKKLEINKLINHSIAVLMDDKNDKQIYTTLVRESYQYAKFEDSQLNDLSIGNSLRRILEAYGTFVYKTGIERLTMDDDILCLCGEYKTYFLNFMYRLILNGESHMEESIVSLRFQSFYESNTDDEKRITAQRVLCFLYLINPLHIKKQLIKIDKNYEQVIKSWLEKIPKDS